MWLCGEVVWMVGTKTTGAIFYKNIILFWKGHALEVVESTLQRFAKRQVANISVFMGTTQIDN